MQDCIVIGGGPAGLTAALYLARFLRRVTVIDAREGRAAMIPLTHNLGPFPGGISGVDLLARMRSSAELYGANIQTGWVASVECHDDVFQVETDSGVAVGKRVVLACGVVNHRPRIPGQLHDEGLAKGLIRYCPVCDAHEVCGKPIAVLGDNRHGLQEARFLRHFSTSVTLIPPDGTVAIATDGIGGLPSPLKDLALSDSQVIVTLETGQVAKFDTLYIALGTSPRSEVATGLGVQLDATGHVIVDEKQKTSIDGVYAVGDVTAGLDQIAVAIGQGAIAATAIHNELKECSALALR